MKAKKAIKILNTLKRDGEFCTGCYEVCCEKCDKVNTAIDAGKKALMCWLWMSGAIKSGMSDEEIMKVVRQGFLEATDE